MSNYKCPETVKIFIDLKPVDWMSFNQIYTSILGLETSNLYSYIYYQKNIFNHLNISDYNYQNLLTHLNCDHQQFKKHIQSLEKLKLAKLSISHNQDNSIKYLIKLFSPLNIKMALDNKNINEAFKKAVNEDKYSEIVLLTENQDLGYDLELTSIDEKEVIETKETSICSKEVWFTFYDGIFKSTNKEFKINDSVMELVKTYHQDQQIISMEKLQNFAINSIKQKNKSFYICVENMTCLINAEINKKTISSDEHHEYWRDLIYMTSNEALKKFNHLFLNIETMDFYAKINNKTKTPSTLEKWIKDCVSNKNFSYAMLNAMISFVKSFLNKIPINYLIKLSDTIYEEELLKPDEYIAHIKSVIENDSKNKNRLNINNQSSSYQSGFTKKLLSN